MKITIENDREAPALLHLSRSDHVPGAPYVLMPGGRLTIAQPDLRALFVQEGEAQAVVADLHELKPEAPIGDGHMPPAGAR